MRARVDEVPDTIRLLGVFFEAYQYQPVDFLKLYNVLGGKDRRNTLAQSIGVLVQSFAEEQFNGFHVKLVRDLIHHLEGRRLNPASFDPTYVGHSPFRACRSAFSSSCCVRFLALRNKATLARNESPAPKVIREHNTKKNGERYRAVKSAITIANFYF